MHRYTPIGSFKFRIDLKDIYPNHWVLLEYVNNEIHLLDTTRDKYVQVFMNIQGFMGWYRIKSEESPFHILNFEEITSTKIGRQFIQKRSKVSHIHIKSKSPVKDSRILNDAFQFSRSY